MSAARYQMRICEAQGFGEMVPKWPGGVVVSIGFVMACSEFPECVGCEKFPEENERVIAVKATGCPVGPGTKNG